VLRFHATKVFTTFEGGAIVCPDAKTKQRIDYLKNFGFVDEVTVVAPGINGKMNEVQAAFGLLQLRYVEQAVERWREIDRTYRQALAEAAGISVPMERPRDATNGSYFPILVDPPYPLSRDALYERLREKGIYARRYFVPLISDFPMYRGLASARHDNLRVAHGVAQRVLCLSIYPDLHAEELSKVIDAIKAA
jgi:dTDP-4-amino-4,6-dideoxygalactose transaminase